MELNICYMYPDVLNLYGDNGNISILKYRAKQRGIDVNVIYHKSGDEFLPEEYDILYLGGGQDKDIEPLLLDLKGEKAQKIKEYVEAYGVMLSVCSGFEMMGQYRQTKDGEKTDCLKILDFYAEESDERLIGNVVIQNEDEKYVGFENHGTKIYTGDLKPLGEVIYGCGNNASDKKEGVIYKNTFLTFLHGPLLSKNPSLADRLLYLALSRKYEKVSLLPLDDEFEIKAKNEIIEKYNEKSKAAKSSYIKR